MTIFTWTIQDYTLQPSYSGAYMRSATFSSDIGNTVLWCLEIHQKQNAEGNISFGFQGIQQTNNRTQNTELQLRLISPGKASSVTANYTFCLLNNLRKKVCRISNSALFHKDGTSNSVKLPVLNEDLLVNNVLIIICEVKPEAQENPALDVPPCTIIQDLHILLKEELHTDVTLKAEKCKVSAHRAILSARSKVFAAMFRYRTQEQETGCVEIQDVSPESLKQMLDFIYTGKVDNLSSVADDLLPVADKYDLGRLKLLCEESLISSLTINTASRRLILADRYNAGQLKNSVLSFIRKNLSAVILTESGKALLRSHPNLVEEVLITEEVSSAKEIHI